MSDRPVTTEARTRTRYRVTGSIFLIALVVIFIPMLFDGAGRSTQVIPPVPEEAIESSVPRFDDVVPASDVVARVEALRNEVDEGGFMAETGTRLGEPILTPVTDNTKIWAVQAASFTSLVNAQNFRTTLRDAGYEAFISTTREDMDTADETADDNVMYRVAVGPYLDIADVTAAVEQIGGQFDVEPQAMGMTQ